MWQEYSKHGELYPDEMRFQNEMFQGHRKLNLHQLTRSFCSSCFEWCQSFYLRRWNGSGPPSYMIKQPLCLIWGMKKAMRYKNWKSRPTWLRSWKEHRRETLPIHLRPYHWFLCHHVLPTKEESTESDSAAWFSYITIFQHYKWQFIQIIIYSPLCCSKPVLISSVEHKNIYFKELKIQTMKLNGVQKPHWIAQINSKTFFKISFTFHRRKSYRIGTTWGWILCATYPYWSDQDTKLMSINH